MEPILRYLPFHKQRAQVETDADRHAINYSLVAPLRAFEPRPQSRFRAEWVAASAGSVTLLAGTASPLLCEVGEQSDQVMLHLPVCGEGRYRVGRQTLVSRAGDSLVYLPGMPHRAESGHCAGLTLNLDPHRLALCAAAMAGQPESHERFLPRFQEPLQLDQSERVVAFLVGHLGRIVDLIDLEPSRSFELPASLPLEPMIEKAVAALVIPSLVVG